MELFIGRQVRLLCWFTTETVEVKSMEAFVEKWRESGERIVLTEGVNGSENGEDGNETKLGEGGVRIGVCRDENCVGGGVVVIVGCPPEAGVVECAVGVVL